MGISLTADPLYSAEGALHVIQILALAADERDILAAFTVSVPKSVTMHLVYLNWAGINALHAVQWAPDYAEQNRPLPATDYELDSCPIMQAFVSQVLAQSDPIWYIEDIARVLPVRPSWLTEAQSLVVLRLTGRASATQTVPVPHALLCIAWPVSTIFNVAERAFYATLLDFTAAVVSHYRQRLEALEQARQLRELDRLKNQFIASFTHELRTPLNHIISLSSGIIDGATGETNPKTRFDATVIYRAGERLQQLISNILDYGRLESGQPLILVTQPIQIAPLIDEAMKLVRCLAAEKPVEVSASLPPELPMVVADPERVSQVLTNLLVNAVKFTDRGTVEVTTRQTERELIVCVQDSGIGIAPEDHGIIFEPFRQLDRSPGKGGVGLGLSICKQFVTLMHGRIWVESQIGEGARFYFSLPIG